MIYFYIQINPKYVISLGVTGKINSTKTETIYSGSITTLTPFFYYKTFSFETEVGFQEKKLNGIIGLQIDASNFKVEFHGKITSTCSIIFSNETA